jgi:transposase InsO family protein
MSQALRLRGHAVGRFKARRLMKEAGVQVRQRRRYKNTTNSQHSLPVYDNVLSRQFDVAEADQSYVGDITYIWTQEGWLYLAVVIDLSLRKVVGWSMSSRMRTELVCDALEMAIGQRQPGPGLICHSDRGSQYASNKYGKLLQRHGFVGSMSRKGDCWDNSVVESFFGSLKQEQVQWQFYQTRFQAQQDVLDYITVFYNEHRLHSYLGYMSPNAYERQLLENRKVS